MAKNKKVQKLTKKQELINLIHRRELVVGVITLGVILILGGSLGFNKLNKVKTQSPRQETSSTFITPTPVATPTLGETENIKSLSDTSSSDEIYVLNNDSYWKIAKRVCGNGKLFLSISEQNEGQNLHPGDFVKVSCSY